MNQKQNKRFVFCLYASAASIMVLTGFKGIDREPYADAAPAVQMVSDNTPEWEFPQIVDEIHGGVLEDVKSAAKDAHAAYLEKIEEEKAVAEAQRIAEEKAAAEARALAESQAAQTASSESVSVSDQELLAALIFCEAGNQPYEGQVAVGAVVMNRVKSGLYPNTISEVIYQSGQFTPAMTGWLDSVLANGGYTDSAMQAAADAIAGSNPVEGCLYFNTGGGGLQIGDHYFH